MKNIECYPFTCIFEYCFECGKIMPFTDDLKCIYCGSDSPFGEFYDESITTKEYDQYIHEHSITVGLTSELSNDIINILNDL